MHEGVARLLDGAFQDGISTFSTVPGMSVDRNTKVWHSICARLRPMLSQSGDAHSVLLIARVLTQMGESVSAPPFGVVGDADPTARNHVAHQLDHALLHDGSLNGGSFKLLVVYVDSDDAVSISGEARQRDGTT
jgi:hypothetical protein